MVTEVYNLQNLCPGFRDNCSGGPDLWDHQMTSPYYFVPHQVQQQKDSDPPPGMLRFNTDIGRLRYGGTITGNDTWETSASIMFLWII